MAAPDRQGGTRPKRQSLTKIEEPDKTKGLGTHVILEAETVAQAAARMWAGSAIASTALLRMHPYNTYAYRFWR